ncbi:M15 family metallopeptidase [Proteiniborus sp. MB09-C3]|uniref:M15 family metallopeptidase n=1 Tax=Proteiniborus sp. MB09-C3 TaxID=3050072 RepID=UPI0025551F01|nr:M15 family metallopeptidase [Proteiniborus sp. MB09-C3]WIV11905.1 M15 family metallopeptidase [Proteiniborus sp. MB09-C3]
MRNTSRSSSSKMKRKKRLFNNIIILFILIIAITQIKDRLFPIIKRAIINNSSSDHGDYVLADSDALDKEDKSSTDKDIESTKGDNSDSSDDNIGKGNKEKKDLLKDTVYIDDKGQEIIKNTDDILVLANKERNLASDYKPSDLVIPNVKFSFDGNDQKKYLRKEAATALEELFKEGEKEDIILYAVSGYRSYARQELLFNNRVKKDGVEKANKLVARPGQSEHQTGLAMDVSSISVNLSLDESFGQTVEGIWLKENAHKFGFIIRYSNEKIDITGYSYEPWHIRYVGKDVAEEIYEKDITLEEYLGFESNLE